MIRRNFLPVAAFVFTALGVFAEPLSRKTDIDFFRDVPSRNLKGLATRSDGRLVAGPTLTEVPAVAPADLLWCLEATPDPAKFLLGTGPDGKVIEVTFNADNGSYTARDFAKVDDPQVFALKRLADGALLVGTSPRGALYLVRDGKPVARAALPVDSIYDFLSVDDHTVLAATGNPGRIYKIDLRQFATIGIIADKMTDTKILADRGITLFGEVRDRNVRRIVALPDGAVVAGSSPRGNIYRFPAAGGAPFILQENRDAEVTDLLPQPNGDVYATVVFSPSTGESRITPPAGNRPNQDAPPPPPPAQAEKFGGRSSLLWFPARGFPEVLTSRNAIAFYRLARHDDVLLIAGGEQGDLLGYDLSARLSLTFAGSISSQLNGLHPLAGAPGKFLLLRNNAPGLALLDFNARGAREAETSRIDLGTAAQLGALRFNRLRDLTDQNLRADVRVSNGSDDIEGWSEWTPLAASADGGWRADNLRGRYAKLRLRIVDPPAPAASPATTAPAAKANPAPAPAPGATARSLEIDRAALFSLPQNRRPQLQDFRVLTPNFAVIPAAEQPPPANVSLNQLIQSQPRDDDGKRKGNFLNSQVVPSIGTQVVLWTITDPDNDNFTNTFSLRRDGDQNWIELVANSQESYAQFDTKNLPDGVYFTRLVASEIAPRPVAERLTHTFETDDLIIDHTPPAVEEATARRGTDAVQLTLRGRDALSLLEGIEVVFNNGVRETVEQPADGIRDGRVETFTIDVPLAKISNATSVEVTLFDAAGNTSARRLQW